MGLRVNPLIMPTPTVTTLKHHGISKFNNQHDDVAHTLVLCMANIKHTLKVKL